MDIVCSCTGPFDCSRHIKIFFVRRPRPRVFTFASTNTGQYARAQHTFVRDPWRPPIGRKREVYRDRRLLWTQRHRCGRRLRPRSTLSVTAPSGRRVLHGRRRRRVLYGRLQPTRVPAQGGPETTCVEPVQPLLCFSFFLFLFRNIFIWSYFENSKNKNIFTKIHWSRIFLPMLQKFSCRLSRLHS